MSVMILLVGGTELLPYTSSEREPTALASGTTAIEISQIACTNLCRARIQCKVFFWNNGICELMAEISLVFYLNGTKELLRPKVYLAKSKVFKKGAIFPRITQNLVRFHCNDMTG